MGKINFGSSDLINKNENTLNHYDNEITDELLEHRLQQISRSINLADGYVCYLLGMGAHPKSTYIDLKKRDGIDVVWYRSLLPKYIRFLSFLIASYEGLVKVSNVQEIPEVFQSLVECSMAAIYVFPQSFEKQFLNDIKKNIHPKNYSFGVQENPSYFVYVVDADNSESATGIYEIVSYGVDANYISSVL